MPAIDTIARGTSARQALHYWTRRRIGAAPNAPFRQTWANGTGLWYQLIETGRTRWLRVMVSGFDPLSGRHYVVSIDDHRHQYYASSARLQRRYDGELAPGVTGRG